MAVLSDNPSLDEINAAFQDLLNRIKLTNTTLTNLDLLRIQLVYSKTEQEEEEREDHSTPYAWPLNDFVATCWSKLSTYHAVFFDLPASTYIPWEDNVTIHGGDYLIKMPDNKSIYIPGNKPYVYKPTSYNIATGRMTYQSVEASEVDTQQLIIPSWTVGNYLGRVGTEIGTKTGNRLTVLMPGINRATQATQSIANGFYFNSSGEQVVIPPSLLTITVSSDFAVIVVPQGLDIANVYIPYFIAPGE